MIGNRILQALRRKLSRHHSLESRQVSLKPTVASRGNVLFSHIIEPFVLDPDEAVLRSHSRFWEASQMAETFLDFGYSVDVINWRNKTFIPQKPYSFYIDARHNFERLAPLLNHGCVKIMHIETAHILFHNAAESQRMWDLYKRRGILLRSRRWEAPNPAFELADCAVIFGNDFAINTY